MIRLYQILRYVLLCTSIATILIGYYILYVPDYADYQEAMGRVRTGMFLTITGGAVTVFYIFKRVK
jgi:hypothetical protein